MRAHRCCHCQAWWTTLSIRDELVGLRKARAHRAPDAIGRDGPPASPQTNRPADLRVGRVVVRRLRAGRSPPHPRARRFDGRASVRVGGCRRRDCACGRGRVVPSDGARLPVGRWRLRGRHHEPGPFLGPARCLGTAGRLHPDGRRLDFIGRQLHHDGRPGPPWPRGTDRRRARHHPGHPEPARHARGRWRVRRAHLPVHGCHRPHGRRRFREDGDGTPRRVAHRRLRPRNCARPRGRPGRARGSLPAHARVLLGLRCTHRR